MRWRSTKGIFNLVIVILRNNVTAGSGGYPE